VQRITVTAQSNLWFTCKWSGWLPGRCYGVARVSWMVSRCVPFWPI